VIPSEERRSVQASIVGSIRSLESRNREERNDKVVTNNKSPDLVSNLSEVLGDSSLSIQTESPREDVDNDYKRVTMNNTQSSYTTNAGAAAKPPANEWRNIPSPSKAKKVPSVNA